MGNRKKFTHIGSSPPPPSINGKLITSINGKLRTARRTTPFVYGGSTTGHVELGRGMGNVVNRPATHQLYTSLYRYTFASNTSSGEISREGEEPGGKEHHISFFIGAPQTNYYVGCCCPSVVAVSVVAAVIAVCRCRIRSCPCQRQ